MKRFLMHAVYVDLAPMSVPADAALGGNQRFVGHFLEGLAHKFFGMATPIDRGRIDPVDPRIDRHQNRPHRVRIVLRPPAELPRPANRPGSQPDHQGEDDAQTHGKRGEPHPSGYR